MCRKGRSYIFFVGDSRWGCRIATLPNAVACDSRIIRLLLLNLLLRKPRWCTASYKETVFACGPDLVRRIRENTKLASCRWRHLLRYSTRSIAGTSTFFSTYEHVAVMMAHLLLPPGSFVMGARAPPAGLQEAATAVQRCHPISWFDSRIVPVFEIALMPVPRLTAPDVAPQLHCRVVDTRLLDSVGGLPVAEHSPPLENLRRSPRV